MALVGACVPLSIPSGAPDPAGGDIDTTDPTDPPDTQGGSVDADVPDIAYCDGVADWEPDFATFEEEVLSLVNERRAAGADCGSAGTFEPAAPLTMNAALRCAARLHSLDMATRGFFDHTNPDGDGPAERIAPTGYQPRTWGENIAYGYATPEQVVAGWMGSDGHCANIMRSSFTEIGVGYEPGQHWTQVFGAR
ncbi:MAG: CAP domain-containing protein [Phycisphaerae bacterium]|nr:CAP domain-containing protein [Phycisphaerae bacterium]